MKNKLNLVLFLFLLFNILMSSTAHAVVVLEDSYFSNFKIYTCGYVNTKWLPGEKSGNNFTTYKEIAANFRLIAKQNRKNRRIRAYYTKLAQRIDAKYRASYRGCAKLTKPVSNVSRASLSNLPSLDSLVAANPSTSSFRPEAVIGTPPVLSTIGSIGAKNIFWNTDVVDAIKNGTANPEQCAQFFSSNTDGHSAGYSGCYMSQAVMENLSGVINSGNTLCYMKNIATPANLSAGALTVTSGSLPSGGVTSLFSPALGSSSRIVGLRAVGDLEGSSIKAADNFNAYIRVYSVDELVASNDHYRYDYWSCDGSAVDEIQQGRISRSGTYSMQSYQGGSKYGNFLVTARVLFGADGSVSFDPSQNRTIDYVSVGSGYAGKLQATISSDNILSSKFFNSHGTEDVRYGVNMANISGSGYLTLRFLSGAFKDNYFRSGVFDSTNVAGMEFRSTNYVSAPSLPTLTTISGIDINSDSYFTTPSVGTLPSEFTCGVTPDIGVTMDFANPVLTGITAICEAGRVDNLSFCNSDDLAAAQSNYHTSCP